MDFIKQYFKVVAYAFTGLVFAFASFYLLANLYHYLELRKDFKTDFSKHALVVAIDDNLGQIQRNINSDINKYNGSISRSRMSSVKKNLQTCVNSINNSEYAKLKTKKQISILDVYRLREAYENEVYNNCIVNNLYWLVVLNDIKSEYLENNKLLTKYYFESLKSATSYLKKDLMNNSSYFYNTSVATSSIMDNTKDAFYDVIDAYAKATNFVLYVSDWYSMEVEG